MDKFVSIKPLSKELENRISRNPLLNIDTFIIPSPYILDKELKKDYSHSYVWMEEGEIMGYILVYSQVESCVFHIYKVVTSPFGRGRGIGTFLIEHLVRNLPDASYLYLFIWQRQPDTVEFFEKKGFVQGEPLVYRNLVYTHLSARKDDVAIDSRQSGQNKGRPIEEIGRTRHDARKTLRLLSSMVDMLSVDNGHRIIEDINRETISLINTLNSYRNTMAVVHKVNIKEIITDRIIPYVEASSVLCEVQLVLKIKKPLVVGSHVAIGRALINLISNSLEAIEEAGRKGLICITLDKKDGKLILTLSDNGNGIEKERLIKDENGLPRFVGKTTKGLLRGEGLGTTQIFTTFGPQNIAITSELGKGTSWEIRLDKFSQEHDRWFIQMERRYNEFNFLMDDLVFNRQTERSTVITYIWQMRKMEIFLFDVICQFSKYNNIRDIYRTFLSYRMDSLDREHFLEASKEWENDYPVLKEWVLNLADQIRSRRRYLKTSVEADRFRGSLFKSWGQAVNNVIIFTLNPASGRFLATDRKLAEHLDFAPYLGGVKEKLLRGEFAGDINHLSQPLFLGVWQVKDEEDLMVKLKLIRAGARALVEMGINPHKTLSLYQTTYVHHNRDINSDKSTTLGIFGDHSDEELKNYIRETEEDFQGFIMMQD
ncbi:MAG: GNAT family N-acetyltransferase [Spirochaetales bacterium]|nr:GNAT family N-acetyltransferase [Spirochaetales bacterium]